MQDWITNYLTMKTNLTQMHSLLLKKEVDSAIDLALQIAAEARMCARQLELQRDKL